MSFVHLHTHSHYSLLDGLSKIPDLVSRAKELGMTSLALTDHGTMYGAIEFYQTCKKQHIKPILGVETYVTPDMHMHDSAAERYHLILLAITNEGWKNLLTIVTAAHLEGFYYKARVDKAYLKNHAQGIVALSGCMSGEIPKALMRGDEEKAEALLKEYQDIFGKEHFFIEISHHPGIPEHDALMQKLVAFAKKHDAPLVATQDSHYLLKEDAAYQDVLLAIQTGGTVDDSDRMTMSSDDYSLSSPAEMAERFAHVPEAIENSVRIADMANVEIELGVIKLPHFPLPKGETADTYLAKLTREALPDYYRTPETEHAAEERLTYELDVIQKTGFASYFLIVGDIVKWARSRGIVVGPGRGSAAGAIISYLMGITSVDPIKYNLLFERFMNPDRISQPDIDLDFADTRRDEVLGYLIERYGRDHVAQIITFGTMAARAAVRDAGRALGIAYGRCDELAKLIPFGMDLHDALTTVPELKTEYAAREDAKKVFDAALHLEGVVRHASTHACGTVVAKDALTENLPLQFATSGSEDKALVTQFDMHAVEDLGLLKMDILGLANLSIIEETLHRIRERHGKDITPENIPLDDPKAYRMLAKGKTIGVFQLEGAGMTRYITELKPTDFEDVVAMIALYRPGPMELIPSYIKRKHGKEEVAYPHPLLEPHLKSTYGIMIYQEQLMQMARAVAGFSPGEADTLRKAVGKKIKKLLDEQQDKFISGVIKTTGSEKLGQKLWELILPFGRYGFNRSHAVCYAVVAMQTAYLRCYYPVDFMASLLNAEAKNIDRMSFLIKEAKSMGLEILGPDINSSQATFAVVDDSTIRFGLTAIKNVGHNIVTAIIDARRAHGTFTTLTSFLESVQARDLNKKSLEALVMAGALDTFGERGLLLRNMERLLAHQRAHAEAVERQQGSLFGLAENADTLPDLALEEGAPAPIAEKLKWEKALLGLYVSGHPLEKLARDEHTHTLASASAIRKGTTVKVAVLLAESKRILTKNGEPMAFVRFEDAEQSMEGVVFPRTLKEFGHLLTPSAILVAEGHIQLRNGAPNFVCDKLVPLEA